MKALIVDDENKAREVLQLLLNFHAPQILEIKEAENGDEATELLASYSPDLVFLDVKMPGQDGFAWLQSLTKRNFDVIFTTAHDQYAIEAIRYSAFDFLLKPIDVEDLTNAMNRYLSTSITNQQNYDNLFYNVANKNTRQYRLTISTLEQTYYLDPNEIIRCEAEGNYTHFYMNNGKRILSSKPLGHFSTLLPKNQFIRCHKSHLVNRIYIDSMIENKLNLSNSEEIEISRRRKALVKEALS